MAAQCVINFHPIGICVGQPGLRSGVGLLWGSLHCNKPFVDRAWYSHLLSHLSRSINRLVPDPNGHLGTHTSLCVRSADKYNLAERIGWLLADLQNGASGSDTLFGSGLERCANSGQRSDLRSAVWNDRFHGCGQSAVWFSMEWARLNLQMVLESSK